LGGLDHAISLQTTNEALIAPTQTINQIAHILSVLLDRHTRNDNVHVD
jgi:hypothetical protein